MRRYTEEPPDGELFPRVIYVFQSYRSNWRWYLLWDGTQVEGDVTDSDDVRALYLPGRIARGEVVPIPVCDAKGRRIRP